MQPEQDTGVASDAVARHAAKLARAAKKAAQDAEPHARRLAGDAARAARPAAQRAAELAREHEAELRKAAALGARIAASRVVPPAFSPAVNAFTEGFVTGVRTDPANAPSENEPAPEATAEDSPPADGPLIF